MELNLDLLWELLVDDWLSVLIKISLAEFLVLRVLGISSVLEQLNNLLSRKVISDVADL